MNDNGFFKNQYFWVDSVFDFFFKTALVVHAESTAKMTTTRVSVIFFFSCHSWIKKEGLSKKWTFLNIVNQHSVMFNGNVLYVCRSVCLFSKKTNKIFPGSSMSLMVKTFLIAIFPGVADVKFFNLLECLC